MRQMRHRFWTWLVLLSVNLLIIPSIRPTLGAPPLTESQSPSESASAGSPSSSPPTFYDLVQAATQSVHASLYGGVPTTSGVVFKLDQVFSGPGGYSGTSPDGRAFTLTVVEAVDHSEIANPVYGANAVDIETWNDLGLSAYGCIAIIRSATGGAVAISLLMARSPSANSQFLITHTHSLDVLNSLQSLLDFEADLPRASFAEEPTCSQQIASCYAAYRLALQNALSVHHWCMIAALAVCAIAIIVCMFTLGGTCVGALLTCIVLAIGCSTAYMAALDVAGNTLQSCLQQALGSPACGACLNGSGAIRLYPYCPADFNMDGFLDFSDFDSFVCCISTLGSPACDINADGFLDFTDFDLFVELFEAGCG